MNYELVKIEKLLGYEKVIDSIASVFFGTQLFGVIKVVDGNRVLSNLTSWELIGAVLERLEALGLFPSLIAEVDPEYPEQVWLADFDCNEDCPGFYAATPLEAVLALASWAQTNEASTPTIVANRLANRERTQRQMEQWKAECATHKQPDKPAEKLK